MIRVLLVHDDSRTRQGLQRVLAAAADIDVVDQASDAAQALAAVRGHRPDVIVMGMVGPDGDAAAEWRSVAAPLIVFAPQRAGVATGRLSHNGAVGYICPPLAPGQLVEAVRTVCAGNRFLCPYLRTPLKQACVDERELHGEVGRLTDRELQVFRHLAVGTPNREIARALRLSTKTVSTHRSHIMAKLGLINNVELARFAIEHGLLGD